MNNNKTAKKLSESEPNSTHLLSAMWRGGNVHQLSYKNSKGYFTPVIVPSIAEAIAKTEKLNTQGFDVYFACAEYVTPDNRKVINTAGAWGYWLDIDCGVDKTTKGLGYTTKKEAAEALKEFLKSTNISHPSFMVDSGNGIHVYFNSDKFIPKSEWQTGACKLKLLTEKYGLLADPTRTADIASILRVPNTNNHKDRANLKAVKLKFSKPELMSDILGSIECAYEIIESQTNSNKSKLANALNTSPVNGAEPYSFDVNKVDFYEALCTAYPNPTSREEWRIGMCALAYLVAAMGWPENDVIKIRESWENLATTADKTDNENQWQDTLSRTAEKVKSGEQTVTHLSILKKARENGWQPKDKVGDSVIDRMNLEYAWIEAEAGIYRLTYRDFISTEKFHNAHANQFTTDSGNKPITVSRKWMSDANRRQHKGIVTRPNEPLVTNDGYMNNWKGYAVEPIHGDVAPFKKLYTYLFGEERYPLLWLAHLVQHSGVKMYPSLVVWSTAEGVGKNLLFEAVQNLFPPEHATVISQSEVEDDFSGWIAGTVFAIADEIKAARTDKVRDKLKIWSTATTLRTHDKGQPKRVIPNLLNLVFLSNHADGMHLTDNDRRFFIWEVTAKPLPQPIIDEFVKWRDSGGLSHLLHFLQSIDLTGFDAKGRAPMTQAKFDMVEASRSDLERWCKDVVTGAISLGQEVTTAEKLLSAFCREYPEMKNLPSVSTVGKTIARMGAFTRKNQVRLSINRKVRAIAVNRPTYWETQNEAAWRDEIERKTTIASGVAENASPK